MLDFPVKKRDLSREEQGIISTEERGPFNSGSLPFRSRGGRFIFEEREGPFHNFKDRPIQDKDLSIKDKNP
jgi:hypothetical protein